MGLSNPITHYMMGNKVMERSDSNEDGGTDDICVGGRAAETAPSQVSTAAEESAGQAGSSPAPPRLL